MEATSNFGRAARLAKYRQRRDGQRAPRRASARPGRVAGGGTRLAQQPGDAMRQGAAGRGHDRLELGRTRRFQLRQGARIGEGIAVDARRPVVATQLALRANVAGHPPDRGMVEQQRLDDALQDVDQIIVAADVRQFVKQKRFHLFGRQSGERADRHQHDGTKPAHDRGRLHQRRNQEAHRAGDANAGLEAVEGLLPFGGAGRTSRERRRSARIQPPNRRSQKPWRRRARRQRPMAARCAARASTAPAKRCRDVAGRGEAAGGEQALRRMRRLVSMRTAGQQDPV